MHVSRSMIATAGLIGFAVIVAGAAALSQAIYFGSATPAANAPPPDNGGLSALLPPPAAIPPPPAPPPVEAFGTDRSFTFARDIWLRPGHYIWRPWRQTIGPVGIVVDLGRQIAYVYRAGTLIGVTTVSTGRRHYETPTGSFPILQKATWHRSTIYSGAPMNYMQRLTWGGVALHAGGVPGYRQSHGCIHLPPAFARALFRVTAVGAEVRVVRSMPSITTPTRIAGGGTLPPVAGPGGDGHMLSTDESVASITAAAL